MKEYVKLLKDQEPDAIVWAAGTSDDALGKTIDYQAQVNVYDAMVEVGIERVLVVSSIGTWKEGTPWPDWYNEAAIKFHNSL